MGPENDRIGTARRRVELPLPAGAAGHCDAYTLTPHTPHTCCLANPARCFFAMLWLKNSRLSKEIGMGLANTDELIRSEKESAGWGMPTLRTTCGRDPGS